MSLKILHIIASVDPRSGGPIEGVLRQENVTGGHEPAVVREIVSLDQPDAPYLDAIPLKVHALGHPPTGKMPWDRVLRHYRHSPAYIPWIEQNAHRFDLAIVHGLWNYSVFAASRALPKSGLPYFVFTHGMLDPWFRRYYPLKHVGKQLSWLGVEGPLLAKARSVLFTCEEERVQARGAFFGHSYTGTVVGYGTNRPPEVRAEDRDALFARLPFAPGTPFLLFLSRIHEKKGCDLLIEAFARVHGQRPELRLVIAGPGEEALVAGLKALAVERGIGDRVVWLGPVFEGAKWAAMTEAEAFILPSHQENFGIAVAEALACGTPVLISDKVNIWREIEGAGAGMVAPDTVAGTVDLLTRWFALDAATRARMGEAGRALFDAKFDVCETAPALLETLARQIGLSTEAVAPGAMTLAATL